MKLQNVFYHFVSEKLKNIFLSSLNWKSKFTTEWRMINVSATACLSRISTFLKTRMSSEIMNIIYCHVKKFFKRIRINDWVLCGLAKMALCWGAWIMLATIQWARRGMGEYAPKSLLGHMCMCISAFFACSNNDLYQPTI